MGATHPFGYKVGIEQAIAGLAARRRADRCGARHSPVRGPSVGCTEMGATHPFGYKVGIEQAIARVAARQHGVVSLEQAATAGMSPDRVKHALRSGRWARRYPAIFLIASAPRTWEQELMAMTLLAPRRVFVSHESAAVLAKLEGPWRRKLEVSSVANLRRLGSGVVLHRVTSFPACDITDRFGLPATDPTRTLLDLCAVARGDDVEIALDDALRRRLTSIHKLRWRLDVVGARGRPGAAVLRNLVDQRPLGSVVPESPLEQRVLRELKLAGLPPPQRQVDISDGRRLIARVDFLYPEEMLVIEADGYRYHSGRREWEDDLLRRNALEALRYTVLNVTVQQLDAHAEVFTRSVARLLGRPPQPH